MAFVGAAGVDDPRQRTVVDRPLAAREMVAETDTMDTTHADLRTGNRQDMLVEFVSRRTLDCDGERVRRLLVADETGKQFAVLITPDRAMLDCKTGATYRLRELVGCAPLGSSADDAGSCPDCGSSLREGRVVDSVDRAVSLAAERLDLDEPFGVVDDRSSVERDDGTDAVDDWRPMRADGTVGAPDYVCESCGRHVAATELRDRVDDTGGRDGAEVDHALENRAMESPAPTASADAASSDTVGLAAGGAKDVTSFRENVANGYTPRPGAIGDEGLFYDYHFDTGARTESDALFAPRYATAASEHPLDGETERYLSVGLDSTLSLAEFERPRLDLVVVLDVSGSMDGPFDAYYYDEHGRRREPEDGATTKLEAATRSLCALTEQLRDDDRLGVVLYDHRAHVAKPLRDVGATDMPAIREHVREIGAGGSTNLADGFEAAVDLLSDGSAGPQVERRVVFVTDMMPNAGATGEGELTRLFADAATEGVHTTFVGVGLDANADLADELSAVRGANHYFVHSAAEFERRLGEEFDYMVTPLVYDLALEVDADGYEIDAVHGSPAGDAATDQLAHVGTLFPSPKREGEARGGVILVRIERTVPDAELELVASWTERDGGEHVERVTVDAPGEPETFEHDGIRKAVALTRYARELRSWAQDVHDRADATTGVDDWLLPDRCGRHECESVPLVVSDRYADRFERLYGYLDGEMAAVGDETLRRELDLLETLCELGPATTTRAIE